MAEVLITLGIIGIVASLTLPSVIQHKIEKDTVTRLKKSYSTLANALNLAVIENGNIDTWYWVGPLETNSYAAAADNLEKILPYLKVADNCIRKEGCFNNHYYKFMTGARHIKYNGANDAALLLNDGSLIVLRSYSSDKYALGYFFVDVNGNKGPNVYGKDMFQFIISKYGIEPTGLENSYMHSLNFCNVRGEDSNNTGGCTAWVLYKENLDYLMKKVCWDGYSSGINCSTF